MRCSVRLRKSLDVTVWSHELCLFLSCGGSRTRSTSPALRFSGPPWRFVHQMLLNMVKEDNGQTYTVVSSYCWTGQGSGLLVWFCSWWCTKVLKCIMGDVINMTVVSVVAKLIFLAFFSAYSVFLIINVENSWASYIYIYIVTSFIYLFIMKIKIIYSI